MGEVDGVVVGSRAVDALVETYDGALAEWALVRPSSVRTRRAQAAQRAAREGVHRHVDANTRAMALSVSPPQRGRESDRLGVSHRIRREYNL